MYVCSYQSVAVEKEKKRIHISFTISYEES